MLKSILSRKTLLLLSISFTLLGCGGSSKTEQVAALLKGYYKDAGVVGLRYRCGDQEGVTQTDGEFLYRAGQSCTFFLDAAETVAIREVPSAALNEDGVIIYEDNPIIGQILQSLDSNGDVSDGEITIDLDLIEAILDAGLDIFPETQEEAQAVLDIIDANNGATGVVSEEEAQEHMLTTLLDNSKFYQHCSGRTAEKAIDELDFPTTRTLSGATVTTNDVLFTRGENALTSDNGSLYFTHAAAEAAGAGMCALGDTSAPVITLNGDASITIAHTSIYSDAGASSDDSSTVTTDGFVDTDIGTYTLTYNAIDDAGNIATPVTRTIIITDQAAPVITLVGATSITIAHGSIYTDEGATAADAIDGASSITTPDTVNTSSLGIYILKYNKTDAAGNIATEVTRTVEVTDQTAPVITLNGLADITVSHGGTYSDAGANATDTVDGTTAITTPDVVDTNTVGTYTLKYNATDSAGNNATEVTRTIIVTDQTDPVITLNGSSIINLQVGDTFTDEGATVTDNVDATHAISSPVVVSTSTEGSFTLTYDAVDAAGNDALQITRSITVSLAPPVLAFTTPWTVYELDKDSDYINGQQIETYQAYKFEIGADNKFNIINLSFIQGSFVEYTQSENNGSTDLVLDASGDWVPDTTDNNTDVTFNADNTVATINGIHKIKLLSVDDIEGQTLSIVRDSTLSLLMPVGAEKTIMEHTVAHDLYRIYSEALDYSTMNNDPFTELSQVLTTYCGTNGDFNNVTNPLIQRIAFTCGQENDSSGTLVGIKSDGTLELNIGTWALTTLPNSTILAITTSVDSTYADTTDIGNPIFAMKDSVVWEGRFILSTESEEQVLYNQAVFDALQEKLVAINSTAGSDNFQVINGELIMKSVAEGAYEPATGTNRKTPKNVFGLIGTPLNPINPEVQAIEGDVTFVSAQTGVNDGNKARGRIGLLVNLTNVAGDQYYVSMMLEQRDGNPLQTRVWKDAYNSTTGTWLYNNGGGTSVTALHNKPITAGTSYHFKFEKLATSGRFSIDNYTVDIPLSELPAADMKLTNLRFFNDVKYPAVTGDYIEGKIDNVTVTVRTDPSTEATQTITQTFDSYVNGTIPKTDSLINDIHEGEASTGSSGTSTAYEGTWKSACSPNQDGTSSQTTIIINTGSTNGIYNVKNHVGTACGSTVNLESIINVNLAYPEAHISSVCSNSSKVNQSINNPVTIIDHTGYGGNPAGTTLTLTQAGFENLIALSGQKLSDHIQLFTLVCNSSDGTKLYGGLPTAINDGATDAKRPTELAISAPFIKQ